MDNVSALREDYARTLDLKTIDREREAVLAVLHRRLWWFRFVSESRRNALADDLLGAIDAGF